MHRYYLSSLAEDDVHRIWERIAIENLSAADRIVDRFTATFDLLSNHPESGEELTHRTRSIRRVTVPPFVVYYRFAGGEVNIVRILHGAQQWEDVL